MSRFFNLVPSVCSFAFSPIRGAFAWMWCKTMVVVASILLLRNCTIVVHTTPLPFSLDIWIHWVDGVDWICRIHSCSSSPFDRVLRIVGTFGCSVSSSLATDHFFAVCFSSHSSLLRLFYNRLVSRIIRTTLFIVLFSALFSLVSSPLIFPWLGGFFSVLSLSIVCPGNTFSNLL